MKKRTRLFSRKTNRYFDYRIGSYGEQKSTARKAFLPLFILMIFSATAFFGYSYISKPRPLLDTKKVAEIIQQVPQITQEKIDQKALQAHEDEQLAKTIDKLVRKMPADSDWSVSLRDLKSGRMANVNSDETMPSGGLYDLFLLPSLEKKLTANNWNSKVGQKSVNDCVMAMIRLADKDCGVVLANYVNWRNIDPHNQTLGFSKTKLTDPSTQITTARETADLIYRLQNSQLLSDKARRLVFDALYEQKFRYGIPNGCLENCLIGNKTGETGQYRHDAAVITHGQSKYVLVVMSKNASWPEIASLAKSIDNEMLP